MPSYKPKFYCTMPSYKSTAYCWRCSYKSLAWPSPINWCHLSFTTQCYSLLSVDSTLKHWMHCFVKRNVAKIELSSAKCKILPQEVEVLILPRFLHKPIWYHLHSQKWPLRFWWWWVWSFAPTTFHHYYCHCQRHHHYHVLNDHGFVGWLNKTRSENDMHAQLVKTCGIVH